MRFVGAGGEGGGVWGAFVGGFVRWLWGRFRRVLELGVWVSVVQCSAVRRRKVR